MKRLSERPLVVSPHVLAQRVKGDMVLLDLRTDHYFGLDGVGSRLWDLLVAGEDFDVIREQLLQEYDVSPATLEADMEQWLAALVDAGLVVSGPGGDGEGPGRRIP